jgi:8-oxo-dGTP diphosphatase
LRPQADAPDGAEPALMAPDKCAGWFWSSWQDIPRPIFAPLQKLIDSGFVPQQCRGAS